MLALLPELDIETQREYLVESFRSHPHQREVRLSETEEQTEAIRTSLRSAVLTKAELELGPDSGVASLTDSEVTNQLVRCRYDCLKAVSSPQCGAGLAVGWRCRPRRSGPI